jgi:hypothetical protein
MLRTALALFLSAYPGLFNQVFQDRSGDGTVNYVHAKIYVADQPSAADLAAAANLAARLAFESTSIDLPLVMPVSRYSSADDSVAIVIGTDASRFTGKVIAIATAAEAEKLAQTLGAEDAKPATKPLEAKITPKDYSLARLFTPDGLLGDSSKNFVPDRTDTTIVIGKDAHDIEIANFAARIGLETTGLRLPLVVVADDKLPALENPVLVGASNPYVEKLIAEKKLALDLQPGQGRIEVVEKAFGKQRALVIAGADDAGEAAALRHAAERLPYAWDYGKDRLSLGRVEDDLRRFFALRSPAGQAAAALYKARRMMKKVDPADLKYAELKIFTEGGGEPYLAYLRKQFPNVKLTAGDLDIRAAKPVFEQNFDLPWEVDDLRAKFNKEVLPAVKPGAAVELEARVSESPGMRQKIEAELSAALEKAGADPKRTRVTVLSAYKQGYSWLYDAVRPHLAGAAKVRIYFRELEPARWQTIESPIRWLQEIYPIDQTLARELKISPDAITFEKTASGPTYRVEARNAAGKVLYEGAFDPKFVMRPLFDQFPAYEQVRVTTGWLNAAVNGKTVADVRIKTDPERFWDEFQSKTLKRIHDYVMTLYEGRPRAAWAPYFGSLQVEVRMSEPDYRIGFEQEQISSLEALHEDIYFETLLYFDLLGNQYAGERLTFPGRVIPRIQPAREGRGASVRISFTGKPGPNPRVDLTVKRPGKPTERWTEDLWPVAIEAPKIVGETVAAGHDGVLSATVQQQTDMEQDQRDELIRESREDAVDRAILSSEQARAMIDNIRELRSAGAGHDWLGYEGIERLDFRLKPTEGAEARVALDRGAEYYKMPRLEAARERKTNIVQWEQPISPEECERDISELAAYPEVHPFYTVSSYLGRPVWAMDVMAPLAGKYWSQAKASTVKPVLFISGRQHANEVSSTSHMLKLVEMLVTDPATRKLLDKVNLVVHPITNIDGAALAYELQKTTPNFMLHAGYLASLGMDVTTGQWDADPMYPEAAVRKQLWQMWLPDVVLNPHGYPSHEWVQMFAGYAAWVRTRTPEARDWWDPRGWFMPSYGYIEDPKFPDNKKTEFAIRDRITAAITETLGSFDERRYKLYQKYGDFDPHSYKMNLHDGVLVYTPPKGSKQSAQSPSAMVRYPNVTVLDLTSEAPDETAHGEWMKMVAGAGLQFDLANLKFLAESQYEVKRKTDLYTNGAVLTITRKRPVLPPGAKREDNQ